MKKVSSVFQFATLPSADGTSIGYRQIGSGPGLLIVHGGMVAGQHYLKLAEALAPDFTVSILDRRGRKLSGPPGAGYGLATEVADVTAALETTGARYLFGHSSGALIALRTALTHPTLSRLILFEPPLSIGGSVPTGWLPQFTAECQANDPGSALMTVTTGIGLEPAPNIPHWLMVWLFRAYLALEPGWLDARATPAAVLVPTMQLDMQLVQEMGDTLADYRAVQMETLLLGGKKSPAYLLQALALLQQTLPHAHTIVWPDLDHGAPTGDPELIAAQLREFCRDA